MSEVCEMAPFLIQQYKGLPHVSAKTKIEPRKEMLNPSLAMSQPVKNVILVGVSFLNLTIWSAGIVPV